MVELGDTQRMGLLIGAAAILIFVVVNMAGLLGGGDEKLFIIDLIGIGSMDAMRPIPASALKISLVCWLQRHGCTVLLVCGGRTRLGGTPRRR